MNYQRSSLIVAMEKGTHKPKNWKSIVKKFKLAEQSEDYSLHKEKERYLNRECVK
jgi:hypothetical protein